MKTTVLDFRIQKGSPINKNCSCGKVYKSVPLDAYDWYYDEFEIIGYGWHCSCGSDMFINIRTEVDNVA